MNRLSYLPFSLFLVLVFLGVASAQDWKELTPFKSKCADVKRIFKLQRCEVPVLNVELPKYSVNITFANKYDYPKLRRDVVVQVFVSFNRFIHLDEFPISIAGFVVANDGDISNGRVYTDQAQGISVFVQSIANKCFVTGVRLFGANKSTRHKLGMRMRQTVK